jgi:hypothetical protein
VCFVQKVVGVFVRFRAPLHPATLLLFCVARIVL